MTGEPEAPRGWAWLASSHQFNPFPALVKAGAATWHLWRNVPGWAATRLTRAGKGGQELPPCEQTEHRCWAWDSSVGPWHRAQPLPWGSVLEDLWEVIWRLPAPSQPPSALPLLLAQLQPCLLCTVLSFVQHVTASPVFLLSGWAEDKGSTVSS